MIENKKVLSGRAHANVSRHMGLQRPNGSSPNQVCKYVTRIQSMNTKPYVRAKIALS